MSFLILCSQRDVPAPCWHSYFRSGARDMSDKSARSRVWLTVKDAMGVTLSEAREACGAADPVDLGLDLEEDEARDGGHGSRCFC